MGDRPPANPDELRAGARRFTSAAAALRQKHDHLAGVVLDLGSDWVGEGSQSFQNAWTRFGNDTKIAADALERTANALNKLADAIENAQASRNWKIVEGIGLGLLTVVLTVADVAQAGVDPVTDGATVVTGAEAAEAFAAVGDEFAAVDADAVADMDAIANDAMNVGDVFGDVPPGPSDPPLDPLTNVSDPLQDAPGNLGLDDPTLNPLANDELAQGSAFPPDQLLPYDPPGQVIGQLQPGSCVAASSRMILSDAGIDLPEAYIRTAANVDAIDGGYISNVPQALSNLGLETPYTYQTDLTIDSLANATAGDDSAIVSLSLGPGQAHAIVVDGVEDGMVLIRDPLDGGEAYKITIENFLKLWNGKGVIPTP